MKLNHKVAAVAIATLFAGVSFAQTGSTSKVTVDAINQTQSGLLNKQEMAIGNATGGGKSDVTAKNINQSQVGMLNQQKMNVGNAN